MQKKDPNSPTTFRQLHVPGGEAAPRRVALAAALALCLVATFGESDDSDKTSSWEVAQGDVRIAVPLRPGGAFEARTSSLAGSLSLDASKPVVLAGELSVDLTTIDTGIGLRDRHLRDNYLEVSKGPAFDKALLGEIRLSDADDAGFEGHSAFTGVLQLHGVSGPVAGTVEIRRETAGVRVSATFQLTLTDFGIEPPQYLGVGVGKVLTVSVAFTAASAPGPGE